MNDLPEDLAHPRGERASIIANVVTGLSLIVILLCLGWFYLATQGMS